MNEQAYDSRPETWQHIHEVQRRLRIVIDILLHRMIEHDQSKLESPEREAFDRVTPKLRGLTYGSEEYRKNLQEIRPAIDHHNSVNRHHPEHFANGIRGMTLIDVVEMLCDWKAATLRHADGDIMKSIEINQARFGYSDDVRDILKNTVEDLLWDQGIPS